MMPSPYDYSITELGVKHNVTNQSTNRRCNLLFSISTDYLNGDYEEQVNLFNLLCKLWRATTLVEQVNRHFRFCTWFSCWYLFCSLHHKVIFKCLLRTHLLTSSYSVWRVQLVALLTGSHAIFWIWRWYYSRNKMDLRMNCIVNAFISFKLPQLPIGIVRANNLPCLNFVK